MLSEKRLRTALKTVPLISLEGPFHRFADFWFVTERIAKGEDSGVLEGLGARRYGGRFTPPGKFETLYVALTAETARIEAESIAVGSRVLSVPARPYVHFAINGFLATVLDLTNPAIQMALGTTTAELCAPWRMLQARHRESQTQRLGRMAHSSGRSEAVLYDRLKTLHLDAALRSSLINSPGRHGWKSLTKLADLRANACDELSVSRLAEIGTRV